MHICFLFFVFFFFFSSTIHGYVFYYQVHAESFLPKNFVVSFTSLRVLLTAASPKSPHLDKNTIHLTSISIGRNFIFKLF